jgi:hypothetical protein
MKKGEGHFANFFEFFHPHLKIKGADGAEKYFGSWNTLN